MSMSVDTPYKDYCSSYEQFLYHYIWIEHDSYQIIKIDLLFSAEQQKYIIIFDVLEIRIFSTFEEKKRNCYFCTKSNCSAIYCRNRQTATVKTTKWAIVEEKVKEVHSRKSICNPFIAQTLRLKAFSVLLKTIIGFVSKFYLIFSLVDSCQIVSRSLETGKKSILLLNHTVL